MNILWLGCVGCIPKVYSLTNCLETSVPESQRNIRNWQANPKPRFQAPPELCFSRDMKNKQRRVIDLLVVLLHPGKSWECPGQRRSQWMRFWRKSEMVKENTQIGIKGEEGDAIKRNVLLELFLRRLLQHPLPNLQLPPAPSSPPFLDTRSSRSLSRAPPPPHPGSRFNRFFPPLANRQLF